MAERWSVQTVPAARHKRSQTTLAFWLPSTVGSIPAGLQCLAPTQATEQSDADDHSYGAPIVLCLSNRASARLSA